ncbi:hypothetical protein Hanom_Chr16g01484811 [Helianthus anomalus]
MKELKQSLLSCDCGGGGWLMMMVAVGGGDGGESELWGVEEEVLLEVDFGVVG